MKNEMWRETCKFSGIEKGELGQKSMVYRGRLLQKHFNMCGVFHAGRDTMKFTQSMHVKTLAPTPFSPLQ